jgi:hypothetical protein
VIKTKNLSQITILQPHLINNLLDKFGNDVLGKRICRTPGTPRLKIIRPDKDLELIDAELQSRYRSGVGMLLYLTKFSRPDISNVMRELSKCMDGATIETYLELLRVIKFVLDIKILASKVDQNSQREAGI